MGRFKEIAIEVQELEENQGSPASQEQIDKIQNTYINEYNQYLDEQKIIQGDAVEEICEAAEKRLGLYGNCKQCEAGVLHAHSNDVTLEETYGPAMKAPKVWVVVHYESQKSYDFQGYIEGNDLNKECVAWLEKMGCKIDERDEESFTVEGEFSVSFDDDIPIVEIESMVLNYGDEFLDIVEMKDLDFDKLCDDIAESGDACDWASDKAAADGDRMYDQWKDDQMERGE